MSLLDQPMIQTAMLGAIVAVLLLIQTWAQERRRKLETASARELQAEANAAKVVEKLSARTSPLPAITPMETPDAKRSEP